MSGGGRGRLPPPPGIGDGGASWRMKALKRAQEQAAREGRKLDEVCVLSFRGAEQVVKLCLDLSLGRDGCACFSYCLLLCSCN